MTASMIDEDARTLAFRRKKKSMYDEVSRLFYKLDGDNKGGLNLQEFMKGLHNHDVRAMMESLDLNVKDAETFFHMMLSTSEDDYVTIDRFVDACMHVQGTAANIDVQCLLWET